MSNDGWLHASSHYDSQGVYTSSDALDDAPLLGDYELPVNSHDCETIRTERTHVWHCHWRGTEPPNAVSQLVAAVTLCGFFMVCELIGGYLAGSLAVMCDAAHLLSDCAGFGLALVAFALAAKPTDRHMSYGYRRAEVLGALSSVLLIWILTGIFVYMACVRLYTGDYDIEPDTMMLISGLGVVINLTIALVLHGCCSGIAHLHSHGGIDMHAHSHGEDAGIRERRCLDSRRNGAVVNGYMSLKEGSAESIENSDARHVHNATVRRGQEKNINLRAALVHVIGDLIQSVGVLIAAAVIKLYPACKWMDPVCTFVFGVVVLLTTVRVVRDALAVLMQAVPTAFRYRECQSAIEKVGGVRGVHALHAWGLSTHHNVVTAHVVLDERADGETVLRQCVAIARTHGADSVTMQMERYHVGMSQCVECGVRPD